MEGDEIVSEMRRLDGKLTRKEQDMENPHGRLLSETTKILHPPPQTMQVIVIPQVSIPELLDKILLLKV